jgi:protein SCO1/2
MNQSMLLIEKKFFGNPNFGIVSITIDPRHDSEVLKEHAALLESSPGILTGDRDKIYDLANKGLCSTEALSILGCLP